MWVWVCGCEEERGTSVAGGCWCCYYVVVVGSSYWWMRDWIGGAGGADGACNWRVLDFGWVRGRWCVA